ncbi:MAG: MscL family protein [Candidatus Dormibacteria bacterium]
MKAFRDFLLQQNLVAVATGLVMALAFVAVVNAFVVAFITPTIGLLAGGKSSLAGSAFHIGRVVYPWGAFVAALISFLIVALVVYFLIITPFTHLMRRAGLLREPGPLKNCGECLASIPAAATRCMYCTMVQSSAPPA